jgi:hypothetical protein
MNTGMSILNKYMPMDYDQAREETHQTL